MCKTLWIALKASLEIKTKECGLNFSNYLLLIVRL